MSLRKLFIAPLSFLKFLFLAGIFSVGTFSAGTALAAEGGEVRIGLMTELTGPWVTGSGALCKRGYELARKTLVKDGMYEGKKVSFHYGDTQGVGKASLTEFNRLVSAEDVDLIISNRSQVGMALNPVSKRRKVPLIGIVGHNRFVSENPYSFRTWPSTKLEGEAIAKVALQEGTLKMAVVALEDEWTISFRDEFEKYFKANGGTVLLSESFIASDTDFASLVARLKTLDIDSILVNLGPAQTGSFLSRLYEQKVQAQLYGNIYARNPEVIVEAGKESVEGLLFTEIDVDKKEFREGLQSHFDDQTPNQYKYTCYAGVKLALEAMKEAKGSSREEIYAALQNVTSLNLFGDEIPFVERELISPLVVKSYINGEIVERKAEETKK